MFSRAEFLRRVGEAVGPTLMPGERHRVVALLRGPGPVCGPGPVGGAGAEPDRDGEWVLAATDRRMLLFPVASTCTGRTPPDVQSHPLSGVHVVDASVRGTAPVLILRFPDAVLAWFHPLPAWRTETEQLVRALREGRAVPADA